MTVSQSTSDKILKFWQAQAERKRPGSLVTQRDHNQVSLEINVISSMLRADDHMLDAGCGNGFSSATYCKLCAQVTGIDYSENMIASAREAWQFPNLNFRVGDVLAIDPGLGTFSAIVSTRCLINLTSWDDQKKAIINFHGILNPGGRLILTEGIKQGRDNINKLRVELGLDPLPPVWHNLDFDQDKIVPFLQNKFTIKQDIRFGLYDLLTRANYPACVYPQQPKYGTIFQAVAEKLQRFHPVDYMAQYGREACLELVKI